MFSVFFAYVASRMLYLALHLESSSFPKPLSAKEEKEAFAAMKDGDLQARDKLIRHNLRLVAHIIKKYYAGAAEQEDLISIGTIGLIKAVGTFDYSRGARFATYAARCVENEILMCFRAGRKSQGTVYISDPIDSDGDGNLTLNDVMADSFFLDENYEDKEEVQKLKSFVQNKLDGRERQIIIMRYGLNNSTPLTQQQVCEILNISRSYVSRLESKALLKLRDEFGKRD